MAKGTWNYCVNCGEMVWASEDLKAVTCPYCGKVILTKSATDKLGCGPIVLGVLAGGAFLLFLISILT